MQILASLIETIRACSSVSSVDMHWPGPGLMAAANEIARAVPGAWAPMGPESPDGYIKVQLKFRDEPYECLAVTIYRVARPPGWIDPGHLGRWNATTVAGRYVEARLSGAPAVELAEVAA